MGFARWAVAAIGLAAMSAPADGSAVDSAEAWFGFNGDGRSGNGRLEAVEHFEGNAGYLQYSAADERNQVVNFNGRSWLAIPGLASLDLTHGVTVALRFRMDGQEGVLVSQRAEQGRRSFQIEAKRIGKQEVVTWRCVSPDGDFVLNTPGIEGETWRTVVFVQEAGARAAFYIDGSLVAEETGAIVPRIGRLPELAWHLGAQPYPSEERPSGFFRGVFDGFAVWSRALDPEEVAAVTKIFGQGL